MKVHYDKEVDALYIKLSNQKPDGVIEIDEGVNIDTTVDGKLSGIEIINASQKIDLSTILSYTEEKYRSIKNIAALLPQNGIFILGDLMFSEAPENHTH